MIFWISTGFLVPMLMFIYAIGEQAPKFVYAVGGLLMPLSVVFLVICMFVAFGNRTASKDLLSFTPALTLLILAAF